MERAGIVTEKGVCSHVLGKQAGNEESWGLTCLFVQRPSSWACASVVASADARIRHRRTPLSLLFPSSFSFSPPPPPDARISVSRNTSCLSSLAVTCADFAS